MIEKQNSRSCVLDSAAHVSGMSPGWLIGQIGHNGEESGFGTQEIIWALRDICYCEMIERRPYKQNPEDGSVVECTFGLVSSESRFVDALERGDGVLLGVNHKLKPHAVSWKHLKAYDPATQTTFELLQEDSAGCFRVVENPGLFTPNRFLRLTEKFT
jgi:hypothetical protein